MSDNTAMLEDMLEQAMTLLRHTLNLLMAPSHTIGESQKLRETIGILLDDYDALVKRECDNE